MLGSASNLIEIKRPSSGNTKFVFKRSVVRCLRRFECQGVDDSCRNFTYIPAKPQPPLIINTTFLQPSDECPVYCVGSASGVKLGGNPVEAKFFL